MLLWWVFLPTISYLIYGAYSLYSNIIKASQLGLPYIIAPITPDNPFWLAIQTAFVKLLRYFPFNATSLTRHIQLGWEFHDRYQTHSRLGDAWILVTPHRNWLYVANAAAVIEIFGRGQDFVTPVWQLEVLNVFGPNISTAEGQDWQRQRKLTAAPFNDQKSPSVWNESLRQASDMLNSWSSANSDGINTTSDDTRTLALHVLAYVAFQKSYPFESFSHAEIKSAESLTYRDSIAIILEYALQIMILPESTFSIPFLPQKWQQIGRAIRNFRQYMSKQIEEEQQLMQSGKPSTGTLVSNLVRASVFETTNNNNDDTGDQLKPLTKAEIMGNIFVFNFAGHDTTAISFDYGMLLLVAHPEVQDWVHEEINYYVGDRALDDLKYNEIFPKLKRCIAVLLETLRLYNPLPGIPKYTGQKPTNLVINGHIYHLPKDMLVIPSVQALQTFPHQWGNDSLIWRPERWITKSDSIESEVLYKPPKGTYFPWSEGKRNCPGKKFAQVEWVAAMTALFQNHVSEPVKRNGESIAEARQRVLEVVKDSNVELLLQMRDPGSVSIRWKQRI